MLNISICKATKNIHRFFGRVLEVLMTHRFKKKFGQNFISDSNLIAAIVSDAGIGGDSFVIEVGAGAGSLTRKLASVAKKVISFEIDEELRPTLCALEDEFDNLSVVFGDFMKVDVGEIVGGEEFCVVANLPYYITTAIISKFFKVRPKTMTIMVQNEVADRLCASAGDSSYGAMSVICSAIASVKKMRVVSRKMFFPAPEVDSAIIKFEFNSNGVPDGFIEFVHACFLAKRKTLLNNLSNYNKLMKSGAAEIIAGLGLGANVRAENLSAQQFLMLFEKVKILTQ